MIIKYDKFLNESKIYKNINNYDNVDNVDNEYMDYYQIPFSLFYDGVCIKSEDDYLLQDPSIKLIYFFPVFSILKNELK